MGFAFAKRDFSSQLNSIETRNKIIKLLSMLVLIGYQTFKSRFELESNSYAVLDTKYLFLAMIINMLEKNVFTDHVKAKSTPLSIFHFALKEPTRSNSRNFGK